MDTNTFEIDFAGLERCLERASKHVPVAEPQQLESFINPDITSGRHLFLCELIKVDMAKASELGLIRYLDFYDPILENAFPQGELPLDLVLEEMQIRRQSGGTLSIALLRERHPHLRGVLDRMLAHAETTIRHERACPVNRFAEGSQVDEFTILRPLGQGSFATVYLARQASMRRLVALKVSHHQSDESVVLSQLDHPNIVRVFDQRIDPQSNATLLYMQYVPGGTLADVVKLRRETRDHSLDGTLLLASVDAALLAAEQQVPDDSAVRAQFREMPWVAIVATLGYQLANGLAHAHSQAIMHRDIKPANVLLTMEGIPKLVDFNVSFAADICANAAANFGGSLAYMSPEQLSVISPSHLAPAEILDHRSDLYSLAMVLWELWQGRRVWSLEHGVRNWNEAIDYQLALRDKPIVAQVASRTAAEHALEKALRSTLSVAREDRPRDGFVLAAKLKTVLNPAAAILFEPPKSSWQSWLARLPVFFITGLIVFIPHGLAGAINFQFNQVEVKQHHPELLEYFRFISLMINLVAFTAGGLALMFVIKPILHGIESARKGALPDEFTLNRLWELGFISALIGSVLWLLAGLAFPICLGWIEPRFQFADSAGFFLSLAGCGGMALIYPYFGLTWLSLHVYYPLLISQSMVDPKLKHRVKTLSRRAHGFLAAAAVVPITLLALFILVADLPRTFHGICLALTAVALVVSFVAHQRLLALCQLFLEFIASKQADIDCQTK